MDRGQARMDLGGTSTYHIQNTQAPSELCQLWRRSEESHGRPSGSQEVNKRFPPPFSYLMSDEYSGLCARSPASSVLVVDGIFQVVQYNYGAAAIAQGLFNFYMTVPFWCLSVF